MNNYVSYVNNKMLDPENPITFQRNLYQQEDSKLSRIGVLSISLLIIIFIYVDYTFVNNSYELIKLLSIKLMVFIVSIFVYVYLKLSKQQEYYSLIIFLWWMLLISMVHYVGLNRPAEYIANITLSSSAIFVIYIIFRNKLILQIIPSLYISIGLLLELYLIKIIQLNIFYFVFIVAIIAMNIIGIFASYTITKFREIVLRNLENEYKMKCKLKELAFHDELTSLQNRRSILQSFQTEFERIKRYRKTLSLMILDIDDFKEINDRYGHEKGDSALKFFANIVSLQKRSTDYLGRIGGEEFLLLLPETDVDEAKYVAERILEVLNSKVIDFDGQKTKITVSIGLTAAKDKDATVQKCMRRADDYLYVAKRRGKNNVYSGGCENA